jgi:rubrerythrin
MATIEKIRTEQPVKNTIHNLVQTLSIKLDSASRYSVYQEDAKKDGFDDCAKVFGSFAGQEQEMIDKLVTCLEKHIGDARP